jgi:hypothetical protein
MWAQHKNVRPARLFEAKPRHALLELLNFASVGLRALATHSQNGKAFSLAAESRTSCRSIPCCKVGPGPRQ